MGLQNRIQGDLKESMKAREEVRAWISENIDLGGFASKMQAMKPIMNHFGRAVEGNMVRRILLDQ